MKKKSLNILLWVLTVFMVISALVYFPSAASIIMLLFAVIAIPLEPVRNFWKGKKLTGLTKGILLTVLFFVSVGLAPTGNGTEKDLPADQQIPQATDTRSMPAASDTNEIDLSPLPVSDPDSVLETEPTSESVSAPETTSGPESEPTLEPVPTSQPETSNQPNENSKNTPTGTGNADNFHTYDNEEQQETTASYVLNTNTKKIHYPKCSKVKEIAPKNYSTSNLSEAELKAQGYTTCGVCH